MPNAMSGTEDLPKCSRLRWCVGMASAMAGVPENHEGKGLSPSRGWFTNDTRGALRRWVTYHARPRDRGLIVNYCPWCGADIRFDSGRTHVTDDELRERE